MDRTRTKEPSKITEQDLRKVDNMVDYSSRPEDLFAADLEVYKVVNGHFRQDLREFWVRSNFYLLVQAALVSVYAVTADISSDYSVAIHSVLGVLGFMVAIVWFIVTRGSLRWLQRWRDQMLLVERRVDRKPCYAEVEKLATMKPIMSPSYVTHFLPILFCAAWALLIVLFFVQH
ncbi:MAG: hypothetical protein V3W14_07200 [Candidatus Neomarinimicrobiota bacterium]